MGGWNQLFSYFPLMMTIAAILALGVFAGSPSGWTGLLLIGVIYIAPPLIVRAVNGWRAPQEGVSRIGEGAFSPWLAAHHIQAFYDALPYLESLLRVIPGFYSMWLRLWGSRVGYGVEWPVRMDVRDRHMMDIGNRVVFDHEVELAAHVRKKTEGGASQALVRRVRIGSYAFLGARVRTGPGAIVPANAQVPALALVGVNETFGEGARHPNAEEAEIALA